MRNHQEFFKFTPSSTKKLMSEYLIAEQEEFFPFSVFWTCWPLKRCFYLCNNAWLDITLSKFSHDKRKWVASLKAQIWGGKWAFPYTCAWGGLTPVYVGVCMLWIWCSVLSLLPTWHPLVSCVWNISEQEICKSAVHLCIMLTSDISWPACITNCSVSKDL